MIRLSHFSPIAFAEKAPGSVAVFGEFRNVGATDSRNPHLVTASVSNGHAGAPVLQCLIQCNFNHGNAGIVLCLSHEKGHVVMIVGPCNGDGNLLSRLRIDSNLVYLVSQYGHGVGSAFVVVVVIPLNNVFGQRNIAMACPVDLRIQRTNGLGIGVKELNGRILQNPFRVIVGSIGDSIGKSTAVHPSTFDVAFYCFCGRGFAAGRIELVVYQKGRMPSPRIRQHHRKRNPRR
mmetsp:Transcript_18641/g.46273  ORF Transcript_18641/g.46273 Transcript_18641/m.46273 type:complete len:233 (-) Transcript_18641:135-833(-)